MPKRFTKLCGRLPWHSMWYMIIMCPIPFHGLNPFINWIHGAYLS
uniref:Uncharacterized protein n=1 Tax=Arundo donax TaxID=35708 RepID=A0A0A8YCK4_ARUDO